VSPSLTVIFDFGSRPWLPENPKPKEFETYVEPLADQHKPITEINY
jgi:hypothetical protein